MLNVLSVLYVLCPALSGEYHATSRPRTQLTTRADGARNDVLSLPPNLLKLQVIAVLGQGPVSRLCKRYYV